MLDDDWEALLRVGQDFIKVWNSEEIAWHQWKVQTAWRNYEAIAKNNKVLQEEVDDMRHRVKEVLVTSMYTLNEAELLVAVLEGGADGSKSLQQCITEMATHGIRGQLCTQHYGSG